VIGASYIALECAGFLSSFGFDTTVMARSIFLRGFDQEMAEMTVQYMTNHKHPTKFIRKAIPDRIEKLEDGKLHVYWHHTSELVGSMSDNQGDDIFDTVLVAIGRDPVTKTLGLERVGVHVHPTTAKVLVDAAEQTSVPNIYAIGDVTSGRPELTPVATQAGKLLARRLFGGSRELVCYDRIATTIFTPLEYGCCGMSEEEAMISYQESDIEVFHAHFNPLEWTLPHRQENACFVKLICLKSENYRVLGLHILAPNAGEITQGYAVALRMNATKHDIEATIGIHPTVAEEVLRLRVTKASGEVATVTGC
jgi:pyruvate/2-oxoglutarate dehydrogenase complex dihydrolipoamide dehydrogenase (E3) component